MPCLKSAAPADQITVLRVEACKYLKPLVDEGASPDEIQDHIHALADLFDLWHSTALIGEIVQETTGLTPEKGEDIPFGEKDDGSIDKVPERQIIEPAPGGSRVTLVAAASLAGKKIPPRKSVVEHLVPDRTVTMGGGDGGVGKSLLALHMGVNVSLGRPWLAFRTEQGPVVYLTAEDELDEVHRRLAAICNHERVDLADLKALHIIPLAGEDALLAVPDRDRGGVMKPTRLFDDLRHHLATIRPKLTILDTLADIFGGEELQRIQARSFIGLLRGLSLELNMATLILSHPSLTGLSNGSGTSGSTGWSNSVRSRFFVERLKDGPNNEPDYDRRTITVKKVNYARMGLAVPVRWANGVFVRDDDGSDPERKAAVEERASAADEIFLRLLRQHNEQGRTLSGSPSANYAPKVFADHPDAAGFRQRALASAMERLLIARRIHVAWEGPPSKRRQHLVFGPPAEVKADE